MKYSLLSELKICLSSEKCLYRYIRNIFGFYPGNISLYKLAFRHKSVAKENINGLRLSNERLEYLGDAVLNSVIADFLFKKFPYKDEGFLTEMRSKIVNRTQLNQISRKLGLDIFIESESGNINLCKSITGDTMEAFIGALYLDKGYRITKKLFINRIINVHYDIDELEKREDNFKSKLIEWAQKNRKKLEFKVINEINLGFNKQYEIEVVIDNDPISKSRDFSIKGAEQIAAEKAFKMIQDNEFI